MMLSSPIMFIFELKDSSYSNKNGRTMGNQYVVVGHEDKQSKFLFINDKKEIDAIEMSGIKFVRFKDDPVPVSIPQVKERWETFDKTVKQSESFDLITALENMKLQDIPKSVKSACTTVIRHYQGIMDETGESTN